MFQDMKSPKHCVMIVMAIYAKVALKQSCADQVGVKILCSIMTFGDVAIILCDCYDYNH